jgi:hypothetical protein
MKLDKKKFNKKLLFAAPVVVGGVVAGALVLNNNGNPTNNETVPVSTTTEQSVSTTDAQTAQGANEVPTTPTPPQPPNKPPTPQPARPQGGDTVEDKVSIMNAAGIAVADQEIVDKVVTKRSNWSYTPDGTVNLCAVTPASKMSTAGADYLTNPVTQLKWCDSFAKSRYGSWQGYAQSLGIS